jgi:hypothetical protein
MTDHDNYVLHRLDPQFEDEPVYESSETDWSREARPVDPDIEQAVQRKLPKGHIAFAGGAVLDRYTPKL